MVIPTDGRDFQLDETAGRERIYVFFGQTKLDRCERLLSLVESRSVDTDVRQILRAMLRAASPDQSMESTYSALRLDFSHEP
jgi:hypothetical protein